MLLMKDHIIEDADYFALNILDENVYRQEKNLRLVLRKSILIKILRKIKKKLESAWLSSDAINYVA